MGADKKHDDGSNGGTVKSLRDRFLGKKRRFKVIETEGQTIKVMEPTMAIRDEWQRKMEIQSDDEGQVTIKGSQARGQAYLVVTCAFDPDTDKPIFQPKDEHSLMALPPSGFITDISTAVISFMQDAEEVSKNSDATLSAS